MNKGQVTEDGDLTEIFGEVLESDIAKELGRDSKVASINKTNSGVIGTVKHKDMCEISERFNELIGRDNYSPNDLKFSEIVNKLNDELNLSLADKVPLEFLQNPDSCNSATVEKIVESCSAAIDNYLNKLMEAHMETKEKDYLTDLDFGKALNYLKQGCKVARKGWNGKNMFLWLKPATTIKSEWCKDPELKKLVDENGGELKALGTICMYTHDSSGRNAVLTGWLASQSDMLLEDWYVVE